MASQLYWSPSCLKELIPTPDMGLSSFSAVPLPEILYEGLIEYLITVIESCIRLPCANGPILLRNVYMTMGFAGSTICYFFLEVAGLILFELNCVPHKFIC